MIPDDEPWWMVRANTDNGLPTAAAERDDREDIPEPTDFRPFGYEW